MEVKHIELIKLKPYDKNPRKNEKSIEVVANSIKAYGFRQPIVVDKNMVIVVGHTRFEAARRLNLKTVPVHIADLSKEEIQAYRIMDNKSADSSGWDLDLLKQELISLSDENYDLDLTGFTDLEVDSLLGDIKTTEVDVKLTKECICPKCGHRFKQDKNYKKNFSDY